MAWGRARWWSCQGQAARSCCCPQQTPARRAGARAQTVREVIWFDRKRQRAFTANASLSGKALEAFAEDDAGLVVLLEVRWKVESEARMEPPIQTEYSSGHDLDLHGAGHERDHVLVEVEGFASKQRRLATMSAAAQSVDVLLEDLESGFSKWSTSYPGTL
ncbi:hypothetical protein BASA82_000238 [Batrachochytrium salamandrivorans]|nr:hypothetical protein BASA82_000238 [Batrachochytrium salamandrivorans]